MAREYTAISVTEETRDRIKSHLRRGERYDDLLQRVFDTFEEETPNR
jgi:ribosome-associated translation inhibitor RaiA